MMRRHDWTDRLFDYIEQHRTTTFEWGTHDCCRFANGAVIAMTGDDPMADYTYTNEIGAMRLIKAAGSLEALVERALGHPLESIAFAQRGDVVVADLQNGPTVGVVLGAVAAYAGEVGLVFEPTHKARLAWRIG